MADRNAPFTGTIPAAYDQTRGRLRLILHGTIVLLVRLLGCAQAHPPRLSRTLSTRISIVPWEAA